MFSIFNRYHRHKDYEEAIIECSKELSTLRMEFAKIRGKVAVDARETLKNERERTKKSLPQDVRDIIAQFPDAEVETVLDNEGHAVYSKKLDGI